MNQNLKNYARNWLATNLVELPEAWQSKFKLMYGRAEGKRSVEDTLAMDVKDVINEMPDDRLNWAMQQVENSIKKLNEN